MKLGGPKQPRRDPRLPKARIANPKRTQGDKAIHANTRRLRRMAGIRGR